MGMMIGTAGHIDHGKTALIRALTGRDTDTLKEEKERQISIDLGFTFFDLPSGARAGIVDVPGHEKFLANMLAGITGIDLVLLVIALDEGIMPQTKEHMEILHQLDVKAGIIVLTKADCVDSEWADLIEEDVVEYVRGTAFENWEKVRVSSKTGEGLQALTKIIDALIVKEGDGMKAVHACRSFRMPIDRVLSIEGRGTVITGTVLDGCVGTGEWLSLYPSGQMVRVKGLQSHGEECTSIVQGQRAALLLHGVKKYEVERGMIVASAHSLQLSNRLDVRLSLANGTKRVVKQHMRVHLHIGTSQVLCRISLFGCDEMKAGESCYAQLYLEEPLAVRKKDRFVIRFYSPLETIGGGVVVNELAQRHKRHDTAVLRELEALDTQDYEQKLLMVLKDSTEAMMEQESLLKSAAIQEEEMNASFELLTRWKTKGNGVEAFSGKKKTYYAFCANVLAWEQAVERWILKEQSAHPYRVRFSKHKLREEAFSRWEAECLDLLLDACVKKGGGRTEGAVFWIGTEGVKKDRLFEKTEAELLRRLTQAGYQLLDYRELCPKEMASEHFQDVLDTLVEEGKLVQISEWFYTTRALAEDMMIRVQKHFQGEELLTYTMLKEWLQTTRRSVRALVAYLDQKGITKPFAGETERKKGPYCE